MPRGYNGGHEPIAIQSAWSAPFYDGRCCLCRDTLVRPAEAFVCVLRRTARSNGDHRECLPCTWKARKMVAANGRFLGLLSMLCAWAVATEKLTGSVQNPAMAHAN